MQGRSFLWPGFGVAVLAAACGGAEFKSANVSPDGGGTDAATTNDGGVASDAPQTSDGPVVTCAACSDVQYCDTTTGRCVACADTSRVVFGPPGPMLPVSNGPGQNQVFPRIGLDGTTLRMVYRFDASGSAQDLASSTSWTASAGTTASGVNSTQNESGPLLLPPGVSVFGLSSDAPGNGLLFFDSDRSGRRQIYASTNSIGSGNLTLIAALNNGTQDFHVAVAWRANPQRFYWSSVRPSPTGGTTAGLYSATTAATLAVAIPIVLPNGCHCPDPDLQPWVTPDGTFLLFTCIDRDAASTCSPLDGGRTHLFFARMDPVTGHQLGNAFALPTVNQQGANDVTASLGPEGCSLYFASDRGGSGEFDIYQSHRQ